MMDLKKMVSRTVPTVSCIAAVGLLAGCLSVLQDDGANIVDIIAKDHKVISFENWYGGRRIEFDFNGYNAWLVMPPKGTPVASGRPWTWTMQWRSAFVDRTGASEMLRRGWHHASIDTFKHRMDSKGLEVNRAFQRYLVDVLDLKPRASLIGMSWGGFFSVRYAATYPDCVDRIYLDAPLLTFHEFNPQFEPEKRAKKIGGDGADWGRGPLDGRSWERDPRMPVNMIAPIAKARIPVLLLYGGQDQSVRSDLNAELFIRRMREAGGVLRVGINDVEGRGRAAFGHHPHGLELDQQDKLAEFFEGADFDNPLKTISFSTPKTRPCPPMDFSRAAVTDMNPRTMLSLSQVEVEGEAPYLFYADKAERYYFWGSADGAMATQSTVKVSTPDGSSSAAICAAST